MKMLYAAGTWDIPPAHSKVHLGAAEMHGSASNDRYSHALLPNFNAGTAKPTRDSHSLGTFSLPFRKHIAK